MSKSSSVATPERYHDVVHFFWLGVESVLNSMLHLKSSTDHYVQKCSLFRKQLGV